MLNSKSRKQPKKQSKAIKSNSENVPTVLSQAITESVNKINGLRGAKELGIRTTKADFYLNLKPAVRVIEKRITNFIRKQTGRKRRPKPAAPVADTGETNA